MAKESHLPQHLRRQAVGQDLALLEQHQAGAVPGQAQVLPQQHQGEALLPGQAFQGQEQFLHPQGVQVGGRLVQDQEPGFQGQDRGQGQELALAAGEGGRVPILQAGQTHQPEAVGHPAPEFVMGQGQVFRAEGHLLVHPGAKELGLEILKQQAYPGGQLPGTGESGVGPGHLDAALHLALDQPGDEALEAEGQGGFTRLAGAQDGQALAGPDRQVEPGKDRLGRLFITEAQVGDLDDVVGFWQNLVVQLCSRGLHRENFKSP